MEFAIKGTQTEIYQKLKTRFQELKSQGRFKQVEKLSFDDHSFQATMSGTGFTAIVHCLNEKVSVDLDLAFLLKPLKGQIEQTIRQKIDEVLA